MAVFPLFRVGHAPLFIRWSEIQVDSGNRGLIFKKRKLLLGRQELIPLLVSASKEDWKKLDTAMQQCTAQ
jgi:hypothetical protein